MSAAGGAGRIVVRGIEFQGRHGATAAERRTLRRFQVDVEIDAAAAVERAAASDRLADTVDYHGVCEVVTSVGTGDPFHLVEALAGAILERLGARLPEATITVEVRKLNPPCPGNPAWAAVRLTRPPHP